MGKRAFVATIRRLRRPTRTFPNTSLERPFDVQADVQETPGAGDIVGAVLPASCLDPRKSHSQCQGGDPQPERPKILYLIRSVLSDPDWLRLASFPAHAQ
jgi:hypothetical protein